MDYCYVYTDRIIILVAYVSMLVTGKLEYRNRFRQQ